MFKIYDGREHFYQWDLDRKLIIEDPSIIQVHFCNRTDDCSLVCETYVEDGITVVNVPNILLQTDWKIHVYAYDGSYTKHDECYEVKSRTKPSDYAYTETEILNWSKIDEKVTAAIGETNQATTNAIEATEEAFNATINAEAATETALIAADKAFNAAENAEAATTFAIESASGVVAATDSANAAATLATNAATSANTAAGAANEASERAEEATDAANIAAANVYAAIEEATEAAIGANEAAASANSASDNANTAATNANNAADNANTAVSNMNITFANILKDTASGESVTITDHLEEMLLEDYKVYGNSTQDGTPTPETPVGIQSVGDLVTDETSEYYGKYDIPITVAGKNLLPYPYSRTTTTINGITFTDNGDGSITINGTATANAIFYLTDILSKYTLDRCGLKIGDSYTISKTIISGDSTENIYFTANYYNKNGSMKAGVSITSLNTATATIQSDFVMWGIYLLVLKDKTVNNATIQLQLEKGTTATEYEPYKGSVTSHIYLDEPLRKIGNFVDYIDFKNQKVIRNIKEVTLDGSESWELQGINENGIISFICSISKETASSTTNVYALSTHYSYKQSSLSKATEQGFFVQRRVGSTNIYIRMLNEEIANITAFKTWLSENNVTVYYQMTTQTEENISLPKPIEEDLSLPTLKTNEGTNIISVATTTPPSNIDVTYYQDTNKVIADLKAAIISLGGNV